MTTKRSQGETNPSRKALVEEKKDTWQSSRTRCSIKQQTSTTGHLSVTLHQDNREEDDRRRITPQGLGSSQWHGQIDETVYKPTLFSLQRVNHEHARSGCRGDSYISCRVLHNLDEVPVLNCFYRFLF